MEKYIIFLFLMVVLLLIPAVVVIIQSLYVTTEYETTIIEDEAEIKRIVLQYSKGAFLETVNVHKLEKEYVEVVKCIQYKTNPKDSTYKEKQSEEILKVIYYKKL